ncbi:trichohyalin-like [Cololabis saira]|uniref:trichohyalin-like n=1 Tax=Cololabis saira TaxID=129043 RepID=UPI002AD29112|nr:trichohyalin-like [Cololabis saira]
MMSKTHRCLNYSSWQETRVNTKSNNPVQKISRKDFATSTVPACDGAKASASSASKASVICRRSSSLSSRGDDSTASGSKISGSSGILSYQGGIGPQAKRQASHPARPPPRWHSSRSFSSLQPTSLPVAPFKRSSHSLSRLDQRPPAKDSGRAGASSQAKKGQANGRRLSSSLEQISSSLVSSNVYHHHNNKGKKETREPSGIKGSWVQTVLKNVRSSSLSEQKAEQLKEQIRAEWTEDSHQLQHEQTTKEPGEQSSVALDSPYPHLHLSNTTNTPYLVEEDKSAHHSDLLSGSTQTAPDVTDASWADGYQSDSSASTVVLLSNDENVEEQSDNDSTTEQNQQQSEIATQTEEQQESNNTRECSKYKEKLPNEHQTVQLVRELEQIQKELSRVQQLNGNLQEELQQERESHLKKLLVLQNGTNSSSEQLQKVNHKLRMELEVLERSLEEAKEAELRRRVDFLAQQAQLLVTGDATALAQLQLKQDRQLFQEQQLEWERCVASLKSQLNVSEEKRRDTESHLTQIQQELQSQHSLQQEAEQLRKNLQEMSAQLRTYEDAQAEKEVRLQKHLMLLQASQERERRSLAASLVKAEQHSQDLQDKLDRTEEQLEDFNRSQALTREIEEAQQQLQEELACTVSAVQQLQEEREQLNHLCHELQNQLSETDSETSRLQDRLNTEETHYYNLEHSYERACEELQVALGKVKQRETETQDIREDYERLLDRKEQELCEILLKMEVLGNSLEETEGKLGEMMKVCTCAPSQMEPVEQKERKQFPVEPFTVDESRTNAADTSQLSHSSNMTLVSGADPHEYKRRRSCSVDASCQYIATVGDDPEKFMSTIQLLETKLFATEEKLRAITQRLEEQQSHISCQDPHLCSQLTQSRATSQHLSLLLHSQAKQSQCFAQETENRCRMLVGRFQLSLNIVRACRERIQSTAVNIPDIERQLATVAACLQQGERDAERVQHESHNASKEDGKILSKMELDGSERDAAPKPTNTHSLRVVPSVENCLLRELFIVEKMLSVLQTPSSVYQIDTVSREDERDVVQRYKSMISQRLALKIEERFESGRLDCCTREPLESIIGRVCAEAELIYAGLKLQQQHESRSHTDGQEVGNQREGRADISLSELAHGGEQMKAGSRGADEPAKLVEKEPSEGKKIKAEKEQSWLGRLVSQLQRRAQFLRQVCHEMTENDGPLSEASLDLAGDGASVDDLNCIQEQVKLIYLSDRLYVDLEQEFQQSEVFQSKLQALCKVQDTKLTDEQEDLNHTLYQLQEDNSVLREELEQAEQKIISVETGNQKLLEDIQKIEDYHKERMQKLESEFREKIEELQQIHEEEMKHLHGYYIKSGVSREKQGKPCMEATSPPPEQAVTVGKPQEDVQIGMLGADASAMREAYLKDLEKLQVKTASCDQGVSAMEEMHRKLIGDLQQQHQKQVAELLKEKDQLLQEETAATLAAIVAMRRAHKQELERSRQTRLIKDSGDLTELHIEYEKEIRLLHRELEALSAQHTEKCLENSQLSQELQDGRKSVMQYQKENQELRKKQTKADEMSQLHEKQSHAAPQLNNPYQMEDKFLLEKKQKTFGANNHNEAHQQGNKDSKFATWSTNRDTSAHNVDDSVKSKSNPAFPKKTDRSFFMRQIRGIRSKSLKDGLSLQEKMKLFESF